MTNNNNNAVLFEHLYKSTKYSDVEFVVNNRAGNVVKIPAHRLVLTAQSPAFESMLFGDLKEGSSVTIVDAYAEEFEVFLKFFYTAHVQMTPSIVVEVYKLADKYLAQGILSTCVTYMHQTLNAQCARNYYRLSLIFDESLSDLRVKSEQLLCKNPSEVFKYSGDTELDSVIMASILKSDELNCKDVDIFDRVIAWAEQSLKAQNREAIVANIRDEIGDMIYDIRFPTMPLEDVAKCFSKYPSLLPVEQCLDIMKYVATGETLTHASVFSTISRVSNIFHLRFEPKHSTEDSERTTSSSRLYFRWEGRGDRTPLFVEEVQIFSADGQFPADCSVIWRDGRNIEKAEIVPLLPCEESTKRRIRIKHTTKSSADLEINLSIPLYSSHEFWRESDCKLPSRFGISTYTENFISDVILKQ